MELYANINNILSHYNIIVLFGNNRLTKVKID